MGGTRISNTGSAHSFYDEGVDESQELGGQRRLPAHNG